METKILNKPKSSTVKELQKEVELLRSFVIGHLGKDSEGEYRPEFIKRILKASADDKVGHVFKDKESFLNYLNADKN